jgi:hypothetical protein
MKIAKIHAAHMGPGITIKLAATDATRQSIPWVETRGPAGAVAAYFGKGATAESVAALPKFAMQCVDCHNRPAHTFERPGAAIDRAMRSGDILSSLPFIKKKGVELLEATYTDDADARKRIPSELTAYYASGYAAIASSRAADIDRASGALVAIWSRNVFPDLKVTWGTYPVNVGHQDTPGCFRCHDGEHATADAKAAIDQDCSTCHEAIAVEEANPEILKTLGISG